MTTRCTWPASTHETNSLKATGFSLRWSLEEKFHTSSPTTNKMDQKTRLLAVEFTTPPSRTRPAAQNSRLSRRPGRRGRVRGNGMSHDPEDAARRHRPLPGFDAARPVAPCGRPAGLAASSCPRSPIGWIRSPGRRALTTRGSADRARPQSHPNRPHAAAISHALSVRRRRSGTRDPVPAARPPQAPAAPAPAAPRSALPRPPLFNKTASAEKRSTRSPAASSRRRSRRGADVDQPLDVAVARGAPSRRPARALAGPPVAEAPGEAPSSAAASRRRPPRARATAAGSACSASRSSRASSWAATSAVRASTRATEEPVALSQQRQQLVAHAVARVAEVGVGFVLDPRLAARGEELRSSRPRTVEQRAHDGAAPGSAPRRPRVPAPRTRRRRTVSA